MRTALSNVLTKSAEADERFVVLSGDHGYALFDELRRARPEQFVNVGIAEQAMVGLAAGMARAGYLPVIYGLAAFVPMRVAEQIKLDFCFSKTKVIILGDGAGLVYSTLGASHQCGEDIACLRPMPHLRVYAPCDAEELKACYKEALGYDGPSYLRIGKSDRPPVHVKSLSSASPHLVKKGARPVCLVSLGSMTAPCVKIAEDLGLSCLSVPRVKPLDASLLKTLSAFEKLIVVEEHSAAGGLASAILELGATGAGPSLPPLFSIALKERFTELCGGYQFALSEHDLSDEQLEKRVKAALTSKTARSA